MGVEGGPSGAVAGPAVGGGLGGGPSLGPVGGPGLGRIGGIEGVMSGAVSVSGINIVNEGPVRGSLEGFRPMNRFDITTIDPGGRRAPLGEIRFNLPDAPASGLIRDPVGIKPAQDEEGMGASILKAEETTKIPSVFLDAFKAPEAVTIPKAPVLEQAEAVRVLPKALLLTKLVGIFAASSSHAESFQTSPAPLSDEVRVGHSTNRLSLVSIPGEQAISYPEEELVEEVRVKEPFEPEEEPDETESKRRIILVRDKHTRERRLDRFKKAFKKALGKLGISKKVSGPEITQEIDELDLSLLSGLVQPHGPDGSLEETIMELNSKRNMSEDEVSDTVLRHNPVKEGTEQEETATEEEVNEVTRHRIFKPPRVLEIVEKRIVRKAGVVSGPSFGFRDTPVKPKIENNLEDLNLADLLSQKAA